MDYRAAATNNNGGVLPALPARRRTVADIDRGGYQVAILDNGTARHAHRRDHAGARPGDVVRAVRRRRAYKPTREWNTLTIKRRRARTSRRSLNGVLASTYDTATRNDRAGYIGLENAGNNLMYRNVRIKELAPDTVAPTVTVDVPARLSLGAAVALSFSCADESELATCVATLDGKPVANGEPLNATPGPHTLVVTATDAEGHTTTRTIPYDVVASAGWHGRCGGPGDARADPRRAGDVRRVHPRRGEDLHRADHGHDHLDRRRRDADGPPGPGAPMRLANGAFTLAQPLTTNLPKTLGGPDHQRGHADHVLARRSGDRAAAHRQPTPRR